MRVAGFERDHLIFDIVAVFGLTAWAAEGMQPWWGVLVTLGVATIVSAIIALGSRLMRLATARLFPRAPAASITVDAAGIRLERRRPALRVSVAWSDMTEIVALKADLYTTDCITLAIAGPAGSTLVVDETMDGWETLVHELPNHIACEPFETWFLHVAFPAFAPSPRRIFPRAEEPAADAESRSASAIAPREAAAAATFAFNDDAASDVRPTRWESVRAYLGSGTGSLFIAVGLLIAAVGAFKHDGRLAVPAAAIAAYVVASRLVLFGAFALARQRSGQAQ